ncbi:hypothetical protein [Methanoculleus chikugoensis]|uniref:hypothetical protein n=1 Tax=Methanoculleus chikugoensis TaxID=118126 RepID=UPI000AF559B8|nr:hypothetical protein [Methanoculleus chikugoensis]
MGGGERLPERQELKHRQVRGGGGRRPGGGGGGGEGSGLSIRSEAPEMGVGDREGGCPPLPPVGPPHPPQWRYPPNGPP